MVGYCISLHSAIERSSHVSLVGRDCSLLYIKAAVLDLMFYHIDEDKDKDSNLKRLEAQSMEEGATPMTKDQRFEARIRAQLEKENEELKRQAETNRMRWDSLEKENSDLASRPESLESNMHVGIQTQVHAVLQTQLTTFFQQMKESRKNLTSPHCDRLERNEGSVGRMLILVRIFRKAIQDMGLDDGDGSINVAKGCFLLE
ncbi:unnamed protein product [Ilex paraguariensis]|uniref:Uncharacterized protein n=1 Tax=Ilex paraguariensis TaxID=185542 RepID=A0ABC8T4W8_9AQUA